MGVKFDRILDAFDGPFEAITTTANPPAGRVVTAAGAAGYVVSHQQNDAFIAVNRLLKTGADVYSLRDSFYVGAGAGTMPVLRKAAADFGLTFSAVSTPPAGGRRVRPVRIGLWDRYGGSVESGWIRWLLERYEFPFEIVYAQTLDAGNLNAKFDVLIFPTDAIPARDRTASAAPANVPAEYRAHLGSITIARTIPALKTFVEQGGTLIAIGSSTSVAGHFGLPVSSALVERAADGSSQPLPRSKFYVPGSLLRVSVDNTIPVAFGVDPQVDVFVDESPAFALGPNASSAGVKRVAWYETASPLRSGWAWGQSYLKGGAAAVDAPLGKGRVLLFGPEITFRAQAHGTFKFLFNGIYYDGAAPASSQALALSHKD